VERNVKNLIGGGIEKAKYRQLANNIQKVADETGSNE
jgi:hypothetical protein